MGPTPDVYDAGRRRFALDAEIRERERDGWMLVHRQGFEATLVHGVRPPWWRVVGGLLLTIVLAAVGGGWAGDEVRRILHVEAFEGGELFRVTVGDVPRGWPRRRRWEVPDGPVMRLPAVTGDV